MKEEFEKLVAVGKIRQQSIPRVMEFWRTKYVLHRAWGLGRIIKTDTVASRFVVNFPSKPAQSIDMEFATRILKSASGPDDPQAKVFQIEQLNWKLLPPGKLDVESLRQQLLTSPQRKSFKPAFNFSRLEFLCDMNPSHVYAGLHEFDGYLAFLFATITGAVLENPLEGNAIYVFDSNWRQLSKLTKSELFQLSGHQVRRIIHNGDWKAKLKTVVLQKQKR